jgi:hypothetical protein
LGLLLGGVSPFLFSECEGGLLLWICNLILLALGFIGAPATLYMGHENVAVSYLVKHLPIPDVVKRLASGWIHRLSLSIFHQGSKKSTISTS